MRMSRLFMLLAFGPASIGCGGSGFSAIPSAPSTVLQPMPSPAPLPGPSQLAVFTDPATGFSTSDMYDVQEQVIRVNTANELIWTADGTRFPEFIAAGNFIAYHHITDRFFQIRFGTKDGERWAYVTWPDEQLRGAPATILDVWVDGRGDLKVAASDVPVPRP
jgi:hypothetical protein